MLTLLGSISGFIGMGGLVLAIVSLLPLNGYNIFLTSSAIIKLILFEYKRITAVFTVVDEQQQHYFLLSLSKEAVLYLSFLIASTVASILHNLTTIVTFCQWQWLTMQGEEAELEEGQLRMEAEDTSKLVCSNRKGQQSNQDDENKRMENSIAEYYSHSKTCCRRRRRKPWFGRLFCLAFLTEVSVALLGTHLTLNRVENVDATVIPLTVQADTLLSCGLLWISSLSIVFFSFIILFASFCLLLGSYRKKGRTRPKKSRASRKQSTRSSTDTAQLMTHTDDEESERRPLLLG